MLLTHMAPQRFRSRYNGFWQTKRETNLIWRNLLIFTTLLSSLLAQAQVVGLATNPQGSAYYSVGAAVAGVMQRKANLTTRVMPMSGSSAYAPLVNRGEIEFGLLNAVDVTNAYEGTDSFRGRKHLDLRLAGVIFTVPIGIVVPNDSPVKSMKDLKGLRMPSQYTSQVTLLHAQDAALATGGVSTADMKPFPISDFTRGLAALGDGKVDAALSCLGCAAAQEAHVALAARGGLRFLQLVDTPEAVSAMRKVFPSGYLQMFPPSAATPGIIVPTNLMVYSTFLATSTHVSDEAVYKAIKAIYENKQELSATAAPLKSFEPSMMAEENLVPYHPGAQKFYKEVGQWPPKNR